MNRLMISVLGCVLVTFAPHAAQSRSYETLLKLYDTFETEDIVWGNESEDLRLVGVIDPAYFTASPEVVEVFELVTYTTWSWERSEPFTRAWRDSLPERVRVQRLPQRTGKQYKHPYTHLWPVHQRMYFAGSMLGLESEVHEILRSMNRRGLTPKLGAAGLPKVARRLGISLKEFRSLYHDPRVDASARLGAAMSYTKGRVLVSQGVDRKNPALYPTFIINGKFVVDTSVVENPREAYRIANRVIRREIEAGRAHDGPTNSEEFTEWMAPRSGEILGRVLLGQSRKKWSAVYNHTRREMWRLDDDGEVGRVYRLAGEGDESRFEFTDDENRLAHAGMWRQSRQYVSFKTENGPQRYGAFLLTDFLSAPDTHWVGLPFKGREAAMAFSADGRVEVRNDKGPMFGSWWLEAGDLTVSFGELGAQSWPWQEVAERIGFDVPQRSLTPWKFQDGSHSKADAKKSPSGKRWSAGDKPEDRGR